MHVAGVDAFSWLCDVTLYSFAFDPLSSYWPESFLGSCDQEVLLGSTFGHASWGFLI